MNSDKEAAKTLAGIPNKVTGAASHAVHYVFPIRAVAGPIGAVAGAGAAVAAAAVAPAAAAAAPAAAPAAAAVAPAAAAVAPAAAAAAPESAAAGQAGAWYFQPSFTSVDGESSNASDALARESAREMRTSPDKRLRVVWTHNDNSQAEFLWGTCGSPTSTKSKTIFYCCICGFPIIPDDEEVFPGKTVGTVDPKWGQGSAEHELYASKGYRYIGLYWKWVGMTPDELTKAGLPNGYDDENVKNFYRKEMKWSHWYCNNLKSNINILKWTDERKTDLEPHEENIRAIINGVWNGKTVSDKATRSFGGKGVEVKLGGYTFSHLIHYFLHITKPDEISTEDKWHTRVLNWKNNRLCAYKDRLNDMIATLKLIGGQDLSRLKNIISERKSNPYGRIAYMLPLTPWPPSDVAITPTPAPVMANFDICIGMQTPEFWANVDNVEDDSDFVPGEGGHNVTMGNVVPVSNSEVLALASPVKEAGSSSNEAAGGAGGSSRLRKTYGGARRYKQRKTLKKRKGRRHTRRRT
jgi:hypothetical protein